MAEVRRATEADTQALIAMGRMLHAESPRYRDMPFAESKLLILAKRLQGTLLAEESCVFVAVTGGEVIGMLVGIASVRWFNDERYVTDLTVYVKPEHRGSSAFFRLVKALEGWAWKQGIDDLALGVSTEIHPNETVRAYLRMGYTLSGHTVTKTLTHGD